MTMHRNFIRNSACGLLTFLLLGGPGACRMGAVEPGNSVVVIYNSRVPESKEVAEHYAKRRNVPAKQVVGFDMPKSETMTRNEYRDSLEKPFLRWLEKNKLFVFKSETQPASERGPAAIRWVLKESDIRYAVLCYGVPVRILKDPTLREEGADQLRPELRRNEAAVDTELALLPVHDLKLPITGPTANPFFGQTNAAVFHSTNGLLMVTRLDGPSPAIARGLVDKAMQAETNGLWGRAYFDMRGITTEEYKLGDQFIGRAAEVARRYGFETIVDEQPETFPASFPMSQIGLYAGWYDGAFSGPFRAARVEFMPGAIAYHLHSFSAHTIRDPNRNWVGPLLAKGVTATMGCVDEPYLAATPDIGTFMASLMFFEFTFGEAAYASQNMLSWQTTVVGDPLYRPFVNRPQALHRELEERDSPLLEWSHLRVVNLNIVQGYPIQDVINYLEGIKLTRQSPVLLEKLGDLYHEQGKPASAIHAYTQAAKLELTPQQEIRLSLALAEKLESAQRDDEALETYEQFLGKFSNYPGALDVSRKALAVAQKLEKTDAVARWQQRINRLEPAKTP